MSDRALALMMAFAMLLVARPGFAQDDEMGGGSDSSMDNEAPPEPEDWEKPPAEQETPRPEVERPTKKALPGGEKRAQVGLLLGWGFKTDRRTAGLGSDPYKLGIGLRGGYTLDFQLYLGGYFVYYIGGSSEGGNAVVAVGTRDSNSNYMMLGAEVGYDVWIGPAMLRPSLGLGMAIGITDATIDGQTTSVSDFALHPGMSLLFPIDDWFVGGDVRANIVTGDGVSGLTLFANGGLRF